MKAEYILIPKQIKVDNAEVYKPGMSIVVEGEDFMVFDVLTHNDITVIKQETTTIH